MRIYIPQDWETQSGIALLKEVHAAQQYGGAEFLPKPFFGDARAGSAGVARLLAHTFRNFLKSR